MKSEQDEALAKKLLRRQRHDFLNEVQVVYSYLQVGKPEKAIQRIEAWIKDDEVRFAKLLAQLEKAPRDE